MDRVAKVKLICVLLVGGLALSILYHWILGSVLGFNYPLNTFLFRPKHNFSDFVDIFLPVQAGSPLGSNLAVYFPFSYALLYPLVGLEPWNALRITLFVFAVVTFYFFWCKLRFLDERPRVLATIIMAFGTYGFLFCFTRANLEMLTFCFVLGFLALFERGAYRWSALPLACAIAMKFYPGVFGVLLLKRRQYVAAAVTAVATLLLTVGASATFPGGVAGTFALLSSNLEHFRQEYILSANTIQFSSNYFAVIKLILHETGMNVARLAELVRTPYIIASMMLFVGILYYIFRYEEVLWKQMCLLSILAIIIPEVSFDYKLIHLLAPLALFVSAPPAARSEDRLYAILFGLVLIPKAYLSRGDEVTINVLLNPILMTIIMAHIVWTGIRAHRNAVAAG